jgi:hypothetical protein
LGEPLFYLLIELASATVRGMGRSDRNSRKWEPCELAAKVHRMGAGRACEFLGFLVGGFSLVLAFAMSSSCTPGRVDLALGQSGGSEAVSFGSGGANTQPLGSGGNYIEVEVNQGQGGEPSSGGTAVSVKDPNKPGDSSSDEPLGFGVPCVLRGGCLPLCDQDPQACLPCEQSESCFGPFPYCDVAQESCVECLTGEDCRRKFGDEFPACSAGKCVQCQRDDDCGEGKSCFFGLCGECRKHYDCEIGESCVERRCVTIPLPPPPVEGSGAVEGSGGSLP